MDVEPGVIQLLHYTQITSKTKSLQKQEITFYISVQKQYSKTQTTAMLCLTHVSKKLADYFNSVPIN